MYDIYTVKQDDTLESIAEKLGTTPEKIYELNLNFNPIEYLQPGRRIIVPAISDALYNYYTVKKGDSLYNIANKYNITASTLALINGLDENDYIYDGQILLVPKENIEVIITKQGDTLRKITTDFNLDINSLLKQNPNIYLQPNQLITYKK